MKKSLFNLFSAILLFLIIVSSCKSTNEVASNKLIQKRKYRSGYYVNSTKSSNSKLKKNEISLKDTESVVAEPNLENDNNSKSAVNTNSKDQNSTQEKSTEKIQISLKEILSESKLITSERVSKISEKISKKIEAKILNPNPEDFIPKKVEPLGLISFLVGIISLFVIPLLFGLSAMILSLVSINKFSNHPGIYKGKGFAIVGLILGIVSVIFGIFAITGAF